MKKVMLWRQLRLSDFNYIPLSIGGLQPISRDTDNNAAMYNC